MRLWTACWVAWMLAMPAGAAEPGPLAIEVPKWFAQSFLDFRDEVRDAAGQGKRVMVYFGQDGCPYCRALMEANFSQRDIVERMQRGFAAVALDLWGDRETVWLDGKPRPEKELARFLGIQFTPTLLFLDESGGVALRLNGYQPPARFRVALEYVERHLERSKTFAQFMAERGAPVSTAPPARSGGTALRLDRPRAKPLALLFASRDCDPCAEMEAAMKRPEVRGALAGVELVRLDAFGNGRVIGRSAADATSEREYARSLAVAFTPTLVFLDRDRNEVFRVEGYVRPFHLAAALAYVGEGAWRREPSFQRYLQARADRERAAGRPVELW